MSVYFNDTNGFGNEMRYGMYNDYDIIGEQRLYVNTSTRGRIYCDNEHHYPSLNVRNESSFYVGGFVWRLSTEIVDVLTQRNDFAPNPNFTPALYGHPPVMLGHPPGVNYLSNPNNRHHHSQKAEKCKLELVDCTLSDVTNNYAIELLCKTYLDSGEENFTKDRCEIVSSGYGFRKTGWGEVNLTSVCTQLPSTVVVRVLKKRTHLAATLFAGIERDKVFIVNGHKFPINSACLSWCSPVFAAMFQTDMIERDSKEIEIKDVSSTEHFADFLAALSPAEPRHPNPSNVFSIAELANRFQIPSLVSVCERHLINCIEIDIGKRFIFADIHVFNSLKKTILASMTNELIRKMYDENLSFFNTRPELVAELFNQFFA